MVSALDGIRILDFSGFMTGPYATQFLGDMGAEVIKVERPGVGDYTRSSGPVFLGGESVVFLSYNRNKKSLAVDLKFEEGRDIVRRLAAQSDVVVQNFRPGVMKSLGLDYESLSQLNPKLIYCSISGYGTDGPYSNRPGQDLIIQGIGGLIHLTGHDGAPPTPAGTYVADIVGALLTISGILTALVARERMGVGQEVNIAMLDGMVWMQPREVTDYLASGEIPQKGGSGHYRMAPYAAFCGSDGRAFTVVAHKDTFPTLCRCIGLPELADDERFATQEARIANRVALTKILQQHFLTRPADEWLALLSENGIWCGPVYDHQQLVNDPQVRHNQMIVSFQHPVAGEVRVPGIPVKLSRTPGSVRRPAPMLGEHSEEILQQLGFSEAEIGDLIRRGIVQSSRVQQPQRG